MKVYYANEISEQGAEDGPRYANFMVYLREEVEKREDELKYRVLLYEKMALKAMMETRKIGKGMARMQRKNKVLKERLMAVQLAVLAPRIEIKLP